MKAILLCAGYGTRLYPLTINTPKALLKVQGKTLLELLIDNLEEIKEIDEIVIVSNDRFYKNFCDFKPHISSSKKITILNDETTSNENRLGAIGDIKFALNKIHYNGEIMVLAGDNWFDFTLKELYDFYVKNGKNDVVFGQNKTDLNVLRAGGVATLSDNGLVLHMEEKPQNPQGTFAVGPFYIYNKQTVAMLDQYLAEGGNPDAPGHFPAWLAERKPVFAYDIAPRHYIDIGTKEAYDNIENTIKNLNKSLER